MDLDNNDKKILFHIDREPLIDRSDLAVLCEVSESQIGVRVQHLFETGVIKYSMPIINLDRLGFAIYIFEIENDVGFTNLDIEKICQNKNIAWLASAVDYKVLLGAIFAKTPIECDSISKSLKGALSAKGDVRFDVSMVTEKYVLGQRYLLESERRTDIRFDNSRVAYEGNQVRELGSVETNVLASVRELKDVSLANSARSVGVSISEMDRTLKRLKRDQVVVKFQPVFDHSKLGVRWFHVSMNARTFDDQYPKLIDFLHELTNIVHINLTLGKWNLNYEVHCESDDELNIVLQQIDEEFGFLLLEKHVVEIGEEHKFNFLVDAVLEAARE